MNTYRIQLAEDLINTYDTFLKEPEHLQNIDDLLNFLRKHGIDGEADKAEADLDAVRTLRDQLRAAWTGDDMNITIEILNGLLSTVRVTLHLQVDEMTYYSLYMVDPTLPLMDRLAFETALGISEAIQTYGFDQIRACAAEPCQDVFIDTSRNHSRRFCSDRCANRYNIQAYRARQQE